MKLVVVTGSGRSGTSSVAGTLKRLGLYIPQPEVETDERNPRGYYEPLWVAEFHKHLLNPIPVRTIDSRPNVGKIAKKARHARGRAGAARLAARPARAGHCAGRDPDPAQGHPRLLGLRPLAADGGGVRGPADQPDDAAPPGAGGAVARHRLPHRDGPALPPPARDHQRRGVDQRGVRDRAGHPGQPAGVRAVLRPDRRLAGGDDAGGRPAGAGVQRRQRPPPGRRLHRRQPQPVQSRLGGPGGRPRPRRPRRPLVGRHERPGRDARRRTGDEGGSTRCAGSTPTCTGRRRPSPSTRPRPRSRRSGGSSRPGWPPPRPRSSG